MTDFILLGEQLITEFLSEIQRDLVTYLNNNDRNATGKSVASIRVENVTNSTGQLVGSASIEYVFRGRGPGKQPPISAIMDWCSVRGIPRGIAWYIARNIAEKGSQLHRELIAAGKNSILDDFITEQRIEAFKNSIITTFVADLKTKVEFERV